MKIAMHQPDFLPYSGFFYKILKSDMFDLAIFDQFEKNGYQRRVKFNDRWVNIEIINRKKLPVATPICDVFVRVAETKHNILKAMDLEYRNTPNYEKVRKSLEYRLGAIEFACDNNIIELWLFNQLLIKWVLKYLGVEKPIMYSKKPTLPKSLGIIEIMKECYPEYDTYLSGIGAKVYTGDEFEKAGLKIEWSKHKAKYNDSVIGILCRERDPLACILQEE